MAKKKISKKKVATQNAEIKSKINKKLEPFGVQETVAINMKNINDVVATQNANNEVKVFVIKTLSSSDVEDILNGKEIHLLKNKISVRLAKKNSLILEDNLFKEHYEIEIKNISKYELDNIAEIVTSEITDIYLSYGYNLYNCPGFLMFLAPSYQVCSTCEQELGTNQLTIKKMSHNEVIEILKGNDVALHDNILVGFNKYDLIVENTSLGIRNTVGDFVNEDFYKSIDINSFRTEEIESLINDMIECMYRYSGYDMVDCGEFMVFTESV